MVVTSQQEDPRAELERLRKLKRLRELEAKAAGGMPEQRAPATPIIDQQPVGGVAVMAGNAVAAPDKKKALDPYAIYFDGMKAYGTFAERTGKQAYNSVVGLPNLGGKVGRAVEDQLNIPTLTYDFRPGGKGLAIEFPHDMSDEMRNAPSGIPVIDIPEATNSEEAAADLIGEGIGFLAPGAAIHKVMAKGGQQMLKSPAVSKAVDVFSKRGSSAADRAARYGQRMASTVPEAGVQAFAFGAATADQDEDAIGKGVEFATNPISYLAPVALSSIYRSAIGLKTGGARVTPKAIAAQVKPLVDSTPAARANASGVLDAVPTPSGVSEKDAGAAGRMLYNVLSDGGVPDDTINGLLRAYDGLPTSGQGARPSLALFLRGQLEKVGYANAVQNIDDALYEIGQSAPEVAEALKGMRASQAQRLSSDLEANLGSQSRLEREKALGAEKATIGEEQYEPIIGAWPKNRTQAKDRRLKALLSDPEFRQHIPADYRSKLSMDALEPELAKRKNFVLDPARADNALNARIDQNSLEVAHKLYSALGKRIREATDGTTKGKLKELQDVLRGPLFDAGGPKYQAANSAFRETAVAQADTDFAVKLKSAAGKTREVELLRDRFDAASPESKDSMRIAVREMIEDEQRLAAEGDPLRLVNLKREGFLSAVDDILGDEGKVITDRIRDAIDEQASIKAWDPNVKTDRGDRLEGGRRAYAGKTGALEYSGNYGLKDIALDAGVSMAAGSPIPFRAVIRGAQKIAARLATPSKSARSAFAKTLLSGTSDPGRYGRALPPDPIVPPPRYEGWRDQVRIDGRFGPKPEILDEMPPERTPPRPMLDDDMVEPGQSVAVAAIDDEYPGPRRISSNRPAVIAGATDGNQPAEGKPMTAADRYVADLRERARQAEDDLQAAARETDARKGDRRAAERAAKDAERLRMQEDAIKNQTKAEALRAERERERMMAAEDRARRAAEDAEAEMNVGAPEVKDGPFQRLGRARDRATAAAGDPRSLRNVMGYLVGDGERALVSSNLRRFGRGANIDWTNAPEVNRANEILRAAQGQKDGIPNDVLDMVGRLNDANKKWLVEQLAEPQQFDLLDIMGQIDTLPPKGKIELEYGATGPFAVGGAGALGVAAGGKALYDAREKRTPEQIEADRKANQRKYYEEGETTFEPPDSGEVRQMQAALNAMGYRDRYGQPLSVDGKMGDRFREAVLDFARANGLQPHGLNPGSLSDNIVTKLREYYQ